jgi:membrane protein DedA with SNARE-associated domain
MPFSLSSQAILEQITSVNENLLSVYVLIAVVMFFNMAILTPPSEFVGIAIGIAAYLSDLNWVLAIAIATIFNFFGTLTWYYAGRMRHNKRFKFKHNKGWRGRMITLMTKVEKVEETYLSHGKSLIFLLRLVPFIRALCSYPAGKIRMKFTDFAKYSIPGLCLWLVIWSILGVALGQVAIKYHLYFSVGLGILTYVFIKIFLTKLSKKVFAKNNNI